MKTCSKCKIEKPFEDFGKHKMGKGGLRSTCKVCRKADWAEKKESHSESRKVKYASDEEYRGRAKGRANATRLAMTTEDVDRKNKRRRDRYAVDPTQRKTQNKRWSVANPDKILAQVHRRNAVKKGVESDNWTPSEVFNSADWNCFYCGVDVEARQDSNTYQKNEAQADHFIPLAKGGTNLRANIVCSCGSCNLRKKDKNPFDFIRDNINTLTGE